jgi:tRNA nucleotidyltransferase (CCA-adding enzyme)
MSEWNEEVLARLRSSPAAAPILGALGDEPDVWIVGGAVRDVLLGREFGELDFVVEGDAAAVARRAAGRLAGTVLEHDRFGTATVSSPAGVFDVTSARTESYPAPGALPEVTPGAAIRDDLARRDFTVNALAVRLGDAAGAALPRALDDLRARALRVLHARSFTDDPTRLLRLARYAARLGFEPDAETAALAEAAVANGALARVSGSRVGEELRLLLREPQPDALLGLERYGLGRVAVHPSFTADGELVREVLGLLPPDGSAPAAVLAACLRLAPAVEVAVRLDALAFPATERDAVVRAVARAGDLAGRLASVGSDSELFFELRVEGIETVALAGAVAGEPVRGAVERWFLDLRAVSLAIDGHDLVAAGLSGPAVGAALDRALAARLDGRALDRDSQLAAALGGGLKAP